MEKITRVERCDSHSGEERKFDSSGFDHKDEKEKNLKKKLKNIAKKSLCGAESTLFDDGAVHKKFLMQPYRPVILKYVLKELTVGKFF